MQERTRRGERGAALVVALLALAVVSALAAGALFSALQDQRLAESTRRVAQARGAAAPQPLQACATNCVA